MKWKKVEKRKKKVFQFSFFPFSMSTTHNHHLLSFPTPFHSSSRIPAAIQPSENWINLSYRIERLCLKKYRRKREREREGGGGEVLRVGSEKNKLWPTQTHTSKTHNQTAMFTSLQKMATASSENWINLNLVTIALPGPRVHFGVHRCLGSCSEQTTLVPRIWVCGWNLKSERTDVKRGRGERKNWKKRGSEKRKKWNV
jgi:hypothetical protein